jgi:hypothetical protein
VGLEIDDEHDASSPHPCTELFDSALLIVHLDIVRYFIIGVLVFLVRLAKPTVDDVTLTHDAFTLHTLETLFGLRQ